jgi:hypothetical protein
MASWAVQIFFSDEIPEWEIHEFVSSWPSGGRLGEGSWVISSTLTEHIWPMLAEPPGVELTDEQLLEVEGVLQGAVRTQITIEVQHSEAAEQLAAEVLRSLAWRWNCCAMHTSFHQDEAGDIVSELVIRDRAELQSIQAIWP